MSETLKDFIARTGITAKIEDGDYSKAPEWARQAWTVTLRYGRRSMRFPFYGGGAADTPTAETVLECVLSDARGLDSVRGFEDWADEYGYDTDSRDAERTYRAVVRQTHRLERFLADEHDHAMQEVED